MNNRRLSFGYEDTDKSIEVELYGLIFEINNINSINEYEKLDKSNKNSIEAQIEKILGKGAIDKINNKRINDGQKELNLDIELNILGCILEAYAKESTNKVLKRVTGAVNDINEDIENLNRENRRRFNRNRGYRRKYRRY